MESWERRLSAALRSSRRDEGWSFILAGNSFSQGELFFRRDFFSQSKLFFKTRTSFHKVNFPAGREVLAFAHESWELVPLDELSLAGILQLRNRRFLVSGMQSPMSLGSSASFRRIVPFRDTSTTESEIPSFRDAKPHGQPLFPSPYPPPRFCLAMG